MAFDESNYEDIGGGGEDPLPEESNNNRTFMIAVGVLGGLILVAVACLGGVYLFSSRGASAAQQAQIVSASQTALAKDAFINKALTSTFQASILPTTTPTASPTATPPIRVPSPTNTLDPAIAFATAGGVGTQSAATATVAAALTQAAAAQLTIVVPTRTVLPGTGIADEYGLPGLVALALVFIVVIFLARRLRIAPTLNR